MYEDVTAHIRAAREALYEAHVGDCNKARREAEAKAKLDGCDFPAMYARGCEAVRKVIEKFIADDEALWREGVRLRLAADAALYGNWNRGC